MVSEAFTWIKTPENPTIVVEGVNSTNVKLTWNFRLDAGEKILTAFFERQSLSQGPVTKIASRLGDNAYSLKNREFAKEYKPNLDSDLVLLDVNNNEEYIYTFEVSYSKDADAFYPNSKATVIVKGE